MDPRLIEKVRIHLRKPKIQFAKELGVSRPMYYKLIDGDIPPNHEVLMRLASILETRFGWSYERIFKELL